MKKIFFFVLMIFISFGAYAESFKKGNKLYVSVKSAQMKSEAGAFAKSVGSLSYGDRVLVLEAGDKFTKVSLESDSSVSGWVSNGSLTKKKIIAKGASSVRASTDELALAGKGFSEEAENAYKASNSNLNFALVDEIESITVSQKELEAFKKEGNLHSPEEE